MTKFVFVTGGVVSSLGKGIAAASLAAILASRGIRVTNLKLDPYINVDPGTMSPFQHGEVFVTEDGAETDLDLGHYERFLDVSMSRANNTTTGQVYNEVIQRERRGDWPVHRRRGDLPYRAGAGAVGVAGDLSGGTVFLRAQRTGARGVPGGVSARGDGAEVSAWRASSTKTALLSDVRADVSFHEAIPHQRA